jgi:hypothetical protein
MTDDDGLDEVAYCGLHCTRCFGNTGAVADLARDLRKELRAYRYDLFAEVAAREGFGKVFADYDKCYQVLGAMVKFRCRKGCRPGGGNPFCNIRKCAKGRGHEGCWECDEFAECEKLEFLEGAHGGAHTRNLRRLRRDGVEEFVEKGGEWYHKPRKK